MARRKISITDITPLKLEIQNEVGRIFDVDPQVRLDSIISSLGAQEVSVEPKPAIKRFLLIVTALFHHSIHGGLSAGEVRDFSETAMALLKTQRIAPARSQLSFLYGDLYFALGQIARNSGDHWKALSHQVEAFALSGGNTSEGESYQHYVLGVRSLRLGHCEIALDCLSKAASLGLQEPQRSHCHIEQIRALRFLSRYQEAEALIAKHRSDSETSREALIEIEWEALLHSLRQTKDVFPLVQSVRAKRKHHDYAYVVEAFLWTRMTESMKWIKRFPTIRKMAPSSNIKYTRAQKDFGSIRTIERLYDQRIPVPLRLHYLLTMLGSSNQLISIDRELMLWAVASRWLYRIKNEFQFKITLEEYRFRSLKLSMGENEDLFGMMGDLLLKRPQAKAA